MKIYEKYFRKFAVQFQKLRQSDRNKISIIELSDANKGDGI